jgi:REP element-mobilizing transposase RayT
MPRPPRIDFPGARHHVMNRGARLQEIFFDDNSCAVFLSLVGEAVERYGIRVHGYALMPNHFHLMVESVRGNLSDAMKLISARYVQAMNYRPSWDGSLFRGRYKNKVVCEDAHWLYLIAYLHLNPVRAHLASTPSQYLWTSHDKYAGDALSPDWLTTEELISRLEGFGGYLRFLKMVMNGSRPVPDGFDTVIYGDNRSQRHFIVKQDKAIADLSVEEALRQVSKLTGTSPKELLKSKRGRTGHASRSVALWWLIYGAGLSNVEASGILGISPSAVGKTLVKIRDGGKTYHGGRVAGWIEKLKEATS